VARASAAPPSHYLSTVLGDDGVDAAWNEHYKQVADAAGQLCGLAADLGVSIFRQAGLADLSHASEDHACLILLTHWRGASLSERDLLTAPDALAEFAQTSTDPLVQMFAHVPEGKILEELNHAIESVTLLSFLPESMARAGRQTPVIGKTLCRDLIDESFYGYLASGNRVELFDGFHAPASVESALAPSFEGEMDLATCNSQALATLLDVRRKYTIRHLHWSNVIHPIPQLVSIAETLKRLGATEGSYIDNRLRLEAELLASFTHR
jgi:hypothetical protein